MFRRTQLFAAIVTILLLGPVALHAQDDSRIITTDTNHLVGIGWLQAIIFLLQLGVFFWQATWLKRTVATMQEANDGAAETAYLEQRAFVSFKECLFMPCQNIGTETLVLIPTWYNSGKTPTAGGRHCTGYCLIETPNLGPPRDSEDILVGPGSSCGAMIEIRMEELRQHRYIFVWGWIEYDDVFRDDRLKRGMSTTRHRTQFLYRSRIGSRMAEGQLLVDLHFTVFGDYNQVRELPTESAGGSGAPV